MSELIVRHPETNPIDFHGMVTTAPQMHTLFEKVRRAAISNATVLIRGESGTGKELVAQALHRESPRGSKPFHAVNCATFTSEMLASELFGHVRGAFTGAVRERKGLLTRAHEGTLFLDEIAELPLDLQARLLRVLQTRRFTPVGATSASEVDVRFICATNASLRKQVATGLFREDLMYRLRVVVLYLPRLVERTGDLEALTWHFIDRFNAQGGRHITSISLPAWEAIAAYAWPGNIRELRNNIEQLFVLGEGPVLGLGELAPEVRGDDLEVSLRPAPPPPTLDALQRAALVSAFTATGGSRLEMAKLLGISRPTLYRRLKKHGLIP